MMDDDYASELFQALDNRMLLTLDLVMMSDGSSDQSMSFNDLPQAAQDSIRGYMHLGASVMLELVREWGWLREME